MTTAGDASGPLRRPDRFFIGGGWAVPSSTTTLDVIDPSTEGVYLRVAAAQQSDIAHAVEAAREAFDSGPWPRMTHGERAALLRAMADGLRERTEDFGQIWPWE